MARGARQTSIAEGPRSASARRAAFTERIGTGGQVDAVLDAALTLFAQQGYMGTRMPEIAHAVKLVPSSLYNHIGSKHDLLWHVCATTNATLLGELARARRNHDIAEQLRQAVEAHVRFAATQPREMIITDREFLHLEEDARSEALAMRRRYERGFRAIISQGREAGRFRVERPKLGSYAIIEMASSVAMWFRPSGPYSVAEVAEEYGEYALRTVGARR